MRDAGIEVEGEPSAVIRANQIVANPGERVSWCAVPPGPSSTTTSSPAMVRAPGTLRPGIHIAGAAVPTIISNFVAENGAEQLWVSPLFNSESLLSKNFISPAAKDRKNLIKVVTR